LESIEENSLITSLLPLIFLIWQAGNFPDTLDLNAGTIAAVQPTNFVIKAIDGAIPPSPLAPSAKAPASNPPTKQKAVLYEENAEPAGKRGSVVWRTASISRQFGKSPDVTVEADVDFPSQRLGMHLSLARNDDKALLASHTLSIKFTLPKKFSHGAVASIPGVLAQPVEAASGVPLFGSTLRVEDNFFVLNLASTGPELKRNAQLLTRSWFVVPFVYTDGIRAMISIEKGVSGECVLSKAFATWGEIDGRITGAC
jgi:hypothetical protein